METFKKNRGPLTAAFSFLFGCLIAVCVLGLNLAPTARAQSGNPGTGGSGQALADIYGTVTGSATNGLTVAAPPLGQKCILRSLVITSGTSGAVILKDCPPATAPIVGVTVGNFAVIANTPLILDDRFFGAGIGLICSETNGSFSVTQSGATVTATSRFSPQ